MAQGAGQTAGEKACDGDSWAAIPEALLLPTFQEAASALARSFHPIPVPGSPCFPRLEGSPPAPPSQSPHCERPPLPLGKRSRPPPHGQSVLPMDYRFPSGEGGAALLCPAPEELLRRAARQ